jgi:quercetin dioxygenase-like cupin family protein
MMSSDSISNRRTFMKKLVLAVTVVVLGSLGLAATLWANARKEAMAPMAQASTAQAPEQRHVFTPDTIPWGPAPPVVPPGAQFAVLEGDPTASSGDYTIRLKMPDGFRIPPHFHPLRENVTVISGTFRVGMGDVFETNKMTSLPSGSFAFLDPNMHHYAMARGEVIVQVHGMSPLQFNYINPQDDPSRNK